jgi:predicted MarR family transcription regulator
MPRKKDVSAGGRSAGIVSSSHLVSPRSVGPSEFEFSLIVAWNAFSRWAGRCIAAAGCPDPTITDVPLIRAVREECLVKNLDADRNADIGELARMLRRLSGMYDQAARAATSL